MFELIGALLREGHRFVSATVIETAGSSPQKPGARLLVLEDGRLLGTVGGGAFERRIIEEAREMLAGTGEPTRLVSYHLTWDLAMCCGGRMRAFLERLGPQESEGAGE